MADDFSEGLVHLLFLLESALSDPVSLIEVLLYKGSCKGQHNSKIDPTKDKWFSVLTNYSAVLCSTEFSSVAFPKHS